MVSGEIAQHNNLFNILSEQCSLSQPLLKALRHPTEVQLKI